MTLRRVIASGLLTAATAVPMLADDAKSTVQVSVQVVRSCRISTGQQVSVDCGTGAQPPQVSYADATPVERPVADRTAEAPAAATTVTIHF